jgi:uncharacterized membrane protein
MTPIGWVHVGLAFLALGLGATAFIVRQGTQRHRQLGYAFLTAMLGLNGSAFLMHRFNGGWGPFHLFAVISLVSLSLAVAPMVKRRKGWLIQHYYWTCWSYVGLVAALVVEIGVRLPGAASSPAVFTAVIGGGTAAVTITGGYFIERCRKALLARVEITARERAVRGVGQILG